MSPVVVDTHTAVWYFNRSPKLSSAAKTALNEATISGGGLLLPSICLVELTYLVERGRVTRLAFYVVKQSLDDPDSALKLAPLDRTVADAIGRVPRAAVPDMPDRIIAATALVLGLPLVTRDARIRA
jgi:PIN domain nuclease of toxin-antitoxin system